MIWSVEMRIQHVLIIAMVFTMFAGCASKRRKRVVEQIESSQTGSSSYWDGCDADGCDACDEQVVDATSDRINPASSLHCIKCNSKQDMLVDGLCVDCMRQQKNVPNFTGFKESAIGESPLPKADKNSAATNQTPPSDVNLLPNKLPPKNAGPSKPAANDFIGQDSSATQPNILQAKDGADEYGQSRSVIEKLESARDEVKGSVESLNDPVFSQPESSRETTRFESPLNAVPNAAQSGQGISPNSQQVENEESEASLDSNSAATDPNVADEALEEGSENGTSKQSTESNAAETTDNIESDETADEEEVQTNESELKTIDKKRSSSISGNASVLPDPKFETFSLDDLFPNLKKNSAGKQNNEQEFKEPVKNKTSLHLKPKRLARSESEVIEDLQNNTIHSRMVFDNTPEIPEQKVAGPEIVLKAIPVRPSIVRSTSKTQKDIANKRSRVPVLQVKTRSPSSESITISPLPQLTDMVDEVDLSVAHSISDEVYDPYRFPEHGYPERGEFEFNGRPNSNSADDSKNRVDTKDGGDLRSVNTGGIVLRAVPTSSSTEISNAIRMPEKPASTAKFKFVQPKFQRPVNED